MPVGVTIEVEPNEIPHLLTALRTCAALNSRAFEPLINFLTAVHQQNMGGRSVPRPTVELPGIVDEKA